MAQSKLSQVFSYQSWVHAVSGATGGVIAMSVFYPLDTVRSRLQVENTDRRKALNTLQVIQQLVREEGLSTLYRGLVPVLQSLCISNFVYFYAFHSLKALNGSTQQSAIRDLLLGSIAGIINVLTTTPFWVVNTRIKMRGVSGVVDDNSKHYKNLLEGLMYVGKTEGMAGLWSGTIPSLMLVINPALQFMMYEMLKRRFTSPNGETSSLSYFLIGAAAKAFATVLTYPLQLVQTKQRHRSKSDEFVAKNAGTIQMIMMILRQQGAKGLFRGLEAKILQTVLTAALMFSIYEKVAKGVNVVLAKKS
ncbi:peroxisomal membrane protein PMP34 [Episyrphus balteatus]|uniref:peroxisomal membrane protein PMP34 n=1 Tax=Episyrphus balteatus TaxID=286459 RepID=UPI00248576C0|nr:peroxisomal membrane protein PMP34 [Episyrphus balteatus]